MKDMAEGGKDDKKPFFQKVLKALPKKQCTLYTMKPPRRSTESFKYLTIAILFLLSLQAG